MHKGSILVADDNGEMRSLLSDLLQTEGYSTASLESGEGALQALLEGRYDLLITDVKMGGISGVALLKAVKAAHPGQAVIMITAFGTTEAAVEAMKLGAFDYVTKPFKTDEFLIVVQKAFEWIHLQQEVVRLRREVEREHHFSGIIGKSKTMREIFSLMRKISDSTANLLISGESGTGKEMVARAIHYNSHRKNGPFVAINCAAIPETLLESELFGHVRGAFTDARFDKKGLFEEAHEGTLFLDEIGEVPVSLQPKLLRSIQEKLVRRVGSTKNTPIDIRIISATNQNLMNEVRNKRFRDDLYYRLNVMEIHMPLLQQRTEDIPLLAEHFLKKYVNRQGKARQIVGFTRTALDTLTQYPWPGNVRELEHVIERAVVLAQTEVIGQEDLPPTLTGAEGPPSLEALFSKILSLEEMQRVYVRHVVQWAGGNKFKAAQVLDIDRKTLYRRLSESDPTL
jgi:DNA-binding NtrC family response regulator